MTGPTGADRADRDQRQVDRWRDAALRGTGVLAGWRRRHAVRRLARLGTPEAARALAAVYLATTDAADDAGVRDLTRQALTALADPAAVDAACEVAIATGDQRLQDLLGQAGHLPSHPARRAMWLFLTGDFDAYTELDHDGALLRAAHQAADPTLRRRIAETARTAGRVEWVRAVVPRPDPDRLTDLTGDDWDATLSVLTTARRFDELWRLAHTAPLPQAARILHQLARHGWQPEPETGAGAERDGYAHLLALADRCAKPLSAASLFEEARALTERSWKPGSGLIRLAMSKRGDLLARLSVHGAGQLWHLPSGESAGDFHVQVMYPAGLAVSSNGPSVAVGQYDGSIHLARMSAGGSGAYGSTEYVSGGWRGCEDLAFTADGEFLVASDTRIVNDKHLGTVWVCHVPTRKAIWSVKTYKLSSGVPSHAMTPDGRLLATVNEARGARSRSPNQRVSLWRLPSGEPAGTIDCGPGERPMELMVTPDGSRLIVRKYVPIGVGIYRADRQLTQMWELPSLRYVATLSDAALDSDMSASDMAMSANGELVGLHRRGRNCPIEVRRTADGELVTAIDSGTDLGGKIAFSRDGRLLAVLDKDSARVWHLPSGTPAGALSGSSGNERFSLTFTAGDALVAESKPSPGNSQVLLWRPEPVLMGHVPVSVVTPTEAERLRQRTRHGDDQPWGELLAALVHWRHRHDIDLAEATAAPSPTDIEATG